jgi:hypothetical protein
MLSLPKWPKWSLSSGRTHVRSVAGAHGWLLAHSIRAIARVQKASQLTIYDATREKHVSRSVPNVDMLLNVAELLQNVVELLLNVAELRLQR